ncbi:unnamed protein product [Angiostrongylus costaricensis]|uniref:SSD domain-containing protein n=1 Tax=Angiostrongylus costaricensis TaxID=334426 RepID=A0A158PJT7_ANGCS|nr:unnamed protein product [Angiostrongylus costaricensis]
MRFDCIERRIAQFFYSYGHYLSSNPLPFVVFPVLFTLAMAIGFLHIQPLTDAVYLFTPLSAPSKLERQAIHEKWPLSDDNYIAGRAVTQNREIQVIALARDGGNILEPPYNEAVFRLDAVEVLHEEHYYSYEDLCLQYKDSGCPGNKHVRRLSDFYNHGINITFPYFRFGTEGGYLGAALGGVSLMRTEKGSSILASARAWFLIYHLKFYPSNISYISGLWEKELAIHLSAYPEDPYIKITYFHSQTLADELRRNADSLSVVNAGMGIVTSIGTLLLLGLPYSDIVSVMPFLVVAVGTDNMFLMVAAMRRTSRCAPVAERMAECLSDAAVSILITATTDALSFGVGAITSLPAVHIFCVYTGVAISFAFIYQLSLIHVLHGVRRVDLQRSIGDVQKFQVTFFAALLAIFTRLEESGRNSILGQRTLTESDIKVATLPERLFNLGSKPEPSKGNEVKEAAVSRFFRDWYAPLLMNNVVRTITMGWYLIYLFFAYYGVTQIKEGLEPTNLLVQDSYAIPHYKLLQKYFWKYGAILQVVVNNAPDLRNATSRDRIHAMVGDFATTRHSIGKESVQFWLYEMESYYHDLLDMKIIDDAFYSMLKHWLTSKHNNPWVEDLYWDVTQDSNVTVKSFRITSKPSARQIQSSVFRFLIGMYDISATKDQKDATVLFREVASRWPEYNITTFMPLWLFTDQYAIIVPNTVQNIVIALTCMVLIAFVLIPQPMCAFWVALACASIDFGVVGYMTLWDVNLDAISMITIIMSIGFSVDYAAHITYGYVVSDALTPSDKVRDALSALGWPLCQGAMSTIIAVSVLADVPAYMIITFYKTVLLSILIGLLHGLVFLPVLLSTFVRGCCFISPSAQNGLDKEKVSHMYCWIMYSLITTAQVTPALTQGSPALECGEHWTPNALHSIASFYYSTLHVFLSPTQNLTASTQLSPQTVEVQSEAIHNRSRNSMKSPEHLE